MRPRFFQGGALALILAALMWGWGPAQAGAEEAGGNLSLNQAINIALKEHPAVKQFRENMAASREGIGIAKSAYFPQANFVGSYYYGNAFATSLRPQTSTGAVGASSSAGLSVPAGNFYFYQFQANQLLYDFGKTPNLVTESRANFKGIGAGLFRHPPAGGPGPAHRLFRLSGGPPGHEGPGRNGAAKPGAD